MICTPQLSYKKTDYEASFGELFPKRLKFIEKLLEKYIDKMEKEYKEKYTNEQNYNYYIYNAKKYLHEHLKNLIPLVYRYGNIKIINKIEIEILSKIELANLEYLIPYACINPQDTYLLNMLLRKIDILKKKYPLLFFQSIKNPTPFQIAILFNNKTALNMLIDEFKMVMITYRQAETTPLDKLENLYKEISKIQEKRNNLETFIVTSVLPGIENAITMRKKIN